MLRYEYKDLIHITIVGTRKERNLLIRAQITSPYQIYLRAFSYIYLLCKYLTGNAMYYSYSPFRLYFRTINHLSFPDIPCDVALHDMAD
jgi:hypothetical protein